MGIETATDLLEQDPTLGEIVRRVAEAYHPLQVYLFGSKARGDAGPDSDYDLLVVVSDNVPEEMRKSALAYRNLWEVGTAADVLVCTESWFRSRLEVPSSLPATVTREGKLLYAA